MLCKLKNKNGHRQYDVCQQRFSSKEYKDRIKEPLQEWTITIFPPSPNIFQDVTDRFITRWRSDLEYNQLEKFEMFFETLLRWIYRRKSVTLKANMNKRAAWHQQLSLRERLTDSSIVEDVYLFRQSRPLMNQVKSARPMSTSSPLQTLQRKLTLTDVQSLLTIWTITLITNSLHQESPVIMERNSSWFTGKTKSLKECNFSH